jgi:exopolysaccharide production protein ExoQ
MVSLAAADPVEGSARREAARGQALLALALGYSLGVAPQMGGGTVDLDTAANLDAAASNFINQAFWLLLFLATVVAARRVNVLSLAWRLWPLTAYLIWSAASVAWAIAPEIVARRWLLQIFVVSSVLLPVVMIDDPAKVRETVVRVALAVLVVNLVALALRPPTAIGHPGIYSHKNELGQMAGLMLIACLMIGSAGGPGLRLGAWLGVPAAILLLVASRSKTSLLLALTVPALGWGIAAIARICRLPPLLPLACVAAVLAPIGFLAAEAVGLSLNRLLLALFGDVTFTGRTDIWDFAWRHIHERPLFGYGFNGFWGIGDESPALASGDELIASILQAHNGYLDILIETGLVGFALFMAFVVVALVRARQAVFQGLAGGAFVLTLILFAMAHNAFESTALRRFHPIWLFLLLAAGLAATARAQKPADRTADDPAC